jgi:hypothetical protein
MRTYGGSEFDENDFILFGEKIKELTYNTYLEVALEDDESPGYTEHVKEELRKYKLHIKEELLDSYGKKSKFNELNDMIVKAANDEGYQEVAQSGSDEFYDFTGLTEQILKKIGINYVLTPDELDSIRNVLESPSPSRGSNKKKKATKKKKKPTKKKKKPTKKKKKPTKKKKKPTKKKKKPTKKKKKPTKKKRTLKKRDVIRGGTKHERLQNGNIKLTVTSYSEKDEPGFKFAKSEDGFSMCHVASLTPNGPAMKAGVIVGEFLLKLNGVDVRGMTTQETLRLLNEPKTWFQKKLGVDNVYEFGMDDDKFMDAKLCPMDTLTEDAKIAAEMSVQLADAEILRDMKAYLREAPVGEKNIEDWLRSSKGSKDTGGDINKRIKNEEGQWSKLWEKAKETLLEESGVLTLQVPEGGFDLDASVEATSSPASSRPSSPA